MGSGNGTDSNAGKSTVKIDLDSRDILRMAAFRRRVTMTALLAELIAPLAEEPPRSARKPRKRDRSRASA
jgi:hypothetical protein